MKVKVKRKFLAWLGLVTLFFALPASSATKDEFILGCAPTALNGVASRHGMTVLTSVDSRNIFLVRGPAGASPTQLVDEVEADSDVALFEPNRDVLVPESPAGLKLNQSTASVLDTLGTPSAITFFGSSVLSSYVNQPAAVLIRRAETHQFLATGVGIVAVIDTGVDPNHPVLKNSLIPGFDFTRNLPGIPSEFADLSQSTASILDQSMASILDQNTVVLLNQSTASILDQSTASILDTTQVPQAFGHGTMVAGIIHLVAPTAQIMPLKAFRADGSSNLFDILRAVYFAVDHGAKVINMSFSFAGPSEELMRAMNFASERGVVCVSSTGNLGKETLAFPASFQNVLGVASTNNLDVRSTFSNFGAALADMAAPGEAIISTFPGKHYAAAWGTSFSTPFVSGAVALLVQAKPTIDPKDVYGSLSHTKKLNSTEMGWGRLDVYRAVAHKVKILPPGAPAP